MKHIRSRSPFQPSLPPAWEPRESPAPREPRNSAERHTGKLIAWRPDRGFGWIKPNSGGNDIFVGRRETEASGLTNLSIGDALEFSLALSNDGKVSAQDLKVLAK